MKVSRMNILGTIVFFACCSVLAGAMFAKSQRVREHVHIHSHRVDIQPSIFENEKWKIIDTSGRSIADSSRNFKIWHNGWSTTVDKSWGHEVRVKVDKNSGAELKVELDPWSYTHRLIPVKSGQLWGFVDHNGKVIIAPKYEQVTHSPFNYGYAAVKETREGPWEILDLKGKTIRFVEPGLEPEESVSEDGILVLKVEGYPGHYSDPKSYYILNLKLKKLLTAPEIARYRGFTFSDGMARYKSSTSEKLGYVNTSGNPVTPTIYEAAGLFSEGLAAVFFSNRYHYIDKKGHEVFALPPDCSLAGDFHNGLAAVALGGLQGPPKLYHVPKTAHWGFVDKKGNIAIPARFRIAREPNDFVSAPDFHCGLCRMVNDNDTKSGVGYINTKGEWVLPPKFADASDFENGFARVCVNTPGFSTAEWTRIGRQNYYSRQALFSQFVRQFNIIGMHKDQVKALLGKPMDSDADVYPDIDSYSIIASSCGNGCEQVDVRYLDDVVVCYRYLHGEYPTDWISNVKDDNLVNNVEL